MVPAGDELFHQPEHLGDDHQGVLVAEFLFPPLIDFNRDHDGHLSTSLKYVP